jgi:hypothetical protein
MISRLYDYDEREKKREKKNKHGDMVRRPAGDNWF